MGIMTSKWSKLIPYSLYIYRLTSQDDMMYVYSMYMYILIYIYTCINIYIYAYTYTYMGCNQVLKHIHRRVAIRMGYMRGFNPLIFFCRCNQGHY